MLCICFGQRCCWSNAKSIERADKYMFTSSLNKFMSMLANNKPRKRCNLLETTFSLLCVWKPICNKKFVLQTYSTCHSAYPQISSNNHQYIPTSPEYFLKPLTHQTKCSGGRFWPSALWAGDRAWTLITAILEEPQSPRWSQRFDVLWTSWVFRKKKKKTLRKVNCAAT